MYQLFFFFVVRLNIDFYFNPICLFYCTELSSNKLQIIPLKKEEGPVPGLLWILSFLFNNTIDLYYFSSLIVNDLFPGIKLSIIKPICLSSAVYICHNCSLINHNHFFFTLYKSLFPQNYILRCPFPCYSIIFSLINSKVSSSLKHYRLKLKRLWQNGCWKLYFQCPGVLHRF